MSKEWHPDKHKGEKNAEAKFKEINEAYEVLSNPERKNMYDQFGSTGANGASGQGGFGGFNANGFDFSGFDTGDLGDLFGSFFGGARGRQHDPADGLDREIQITIDFADVVHGAKKNCNFAAWLSAPRVKERVLNRGVRSSHVATVAAPDRP